MFARLSAAILLALPLLTVADCDTGSQHCCNSLQDANSASVTTLLGNLLALNVQGLTGQVGLGCSPLSVLALSGQSCNQQTVCCSNNNFNGIIALGCTPINVNL